MINKTSQMKSLKILNSVKPNGNLLITDQALEAMKRDAIEFAEWCTINGWYFMIGERKWEKYYSTRQIKTTEELYELKNQKK
jgi:hypothetical protein